jgi:hypothetical protein
LAGDCILLPDGSAKVASQSNGTTKYFIVDGECSCKDYPQAPSNWCVHRIAAGLAKRAYPLAKAKLEQQSNGTNNGTHQSSEAQGQPEPVVSPVEASVSESVEPVSPIESDAAPLVQAEPVVAPVTLPEAPASVNCHILLEGRQVQVTLRDTDETRLLARLATLLQQYPVAEPPTPPPTQGTVEPVPDENPYCQLHKVPLKKFTKDGKTWHSHKTPNGSWCRGK